MVILPNNPMFGSEQMDTKTYARYEARARILKALAHPTRLFIVDELAKKEKSVLQAPRNSEKFRNCER